MRQNPRISQQQLNEQQERKRRMAEFMESERVKQELFRAEFRKWVAKHDQGDGLYRDYLEPEQDGGGNG